jgi:1-acyl-sn-glycerol-3-phosphate acyltransferase
MITNCRQKYNPVRSMAGINITALETDSSVSIHEHQHSSAGKSKYRAITRFMKFFFITFSYIVRIIIYRVKHGALVWSSDLDCTPYVRRWAREVNRCLGIEVVPCGDVPHEGVLLASTHRSYADITAIGEFLPVTFLAKSEVAKWPVIGSGCRLVDVVFVDRKSPESRRISRDEVAVRLRNSISIAVFPEGTSSRGPGLLAFRPGIFQMAASYGYPVVPVAIRYRNPDDAWVGDDMFVPHFIRTFSKKVTVMDVVFGPVLRITDPEELMNASWQWIHAILM